MSKHLISYTKTLKETDLPEWAQCKCGANSGWRKTRRETEEWVDAHHRSVYRVRAALNRREPSLLDQFNYYVLMSEDINVPAAEREQWADLADQLRPRVVTKDPGVDQGQLF